MKTIILISIVLYLIAVLALPAVCQYHSYIDEIIDYPLGECLITFLSTTCMLYDVNGDSLVDFIQGGYNYPWFGDYAHGYPTLIYWNDNGSLSSSAVNVNGANYINVDCMAISDYNCDGYGDILLGRVVIFDGSDNLDGADQLWSYNDSTQLFDNDWSASEAYDTHAIQWVDIDFDGDLDIASLDYSRGYVRFYLNSGISDSYSISSTPSFSFPIIDKGNPGKTSSGSTDNFTEADDYIFNVPNCELEFGDIDQDGKLDMFINFRNPKIFINQLPGSKPYDYGNSDYITAINAYRTKGWESDGDDRIYCGAFGLWGNPLDDSVQLALATGSQWFEYCERTDSAGQPDCSTRYDLLKAFRYDKTIGDELELVWNSSADDTGQCVVDMMWYDANEDGYQDLCTVAHVALDSSGSYQWREINGKDRLYFTDSTAELSDVPGWWSSQQCNWSTSMAVGDIDNFGLVSDSAYCILMGTVNPYFFYLPHFPAIRINSIYAVDTLSSIVSLDRDDYCYDLMRGWVSLDSNEVIAALGGSGLIDTFIVVYQYSDEPDLITSNEWFGCLLREYDSRGNEAEIGTVNIDDIIDINNLDTDYKYTYESSDYWGMDTSGAIGLWIVNGEPEEIKQVAPDIDFWRVDYNMDCQQPFFKEYLWDGIDRWVRTAYEGDNNINVMLSFRTHCNPWFMGNMGDIADTTNDFTKRISNEYWTYMPIRALVDRYRPSGKFQGISGSDGVTLFQFENEPNLEETYGPNSTAVYAIKDKMFWAYQCVKSQSTDFTVVGPNFSTCLEDFNLQHNSYYEELYVGTGGARDSALHYYCDVFDFQPYNAAMDLMNGYFESWDPIVSYTDSMMAYNDCAWVNEMLNTWGDSLKPMCGLEWLYAYDSGNQKEWTVTHNGMLFSFPRMVWSAMSVVYTPQIWSPMPGEWIELLSTLNQQAKILHGYHHYAIDSLDIRIWPDSLLADSVIWDFAFTNADSDTFKHIISVQTGYTPDSTVFGYNTTFTKISLATDPANIDNENVAIKYLDFNQFERQINENNDSAWVTFTPYELSYEPTYMTEIVDGNNYDITIPLPKNEWTTISLNLNPGTMQIQTLFSVANVPSDILKIRNYKYWQGTRNNGTWTWSPQRYDWDMSQGFSIRVEDNTITTPSIFTVSNTWWNDLDMSINITPFSDDSTFTIAYTPCWDMPCSTAFDTLLNWGTPNNEVMIWARNSDGLFYIPGADTVKHFSMRQGEGYRLKMTTANTYSGFKFTYDSTTQSLESMHAKPGGENSQIESLCTSHFNFRKKTQDAYAIVLVDISIEGTIPEPGDEIGVFMWDTLCVGAVGYQGGGKTVITVWEDEICTPNIVDGYMEDEIMSFKYWDASDCEEFSLNVNFTTINALQLKNTVYTSQPIFGLGSYARIAFHATPDIAIPISFALHQNYPNPFNPTTTIKFDLPEASIIKLEVYNVLGQRVDVLMDQICSAGYKTVRWEGTSRGTPISSGVYFYCIKAKGLTSGKEFNKFNKMIMLK